jgi:hypothetical protein
MAEFKDVKFSKEDLKRKRIEQLTYELQALGAELELKKIQMTAELEKFAKENKLDEKSVELKMLQLEQQKIIAEGNVAVVTKQIDSIK